MDKNPADYLYIEEKKYAVVGLVTYLTYLIIYLYYSIFILFNTLYGYYTDDFYNFKGPCKEIKILFYLFIL